MNKPFAIHQIRVRGLHRVFSIWKMNQTNCKMARLYNSCDQAQLAIQLKDHLPSGLHIHLPVTLSIIT